MSFTDRFAKFYRRFLPSPFTIALLLTGVTFLLALLFTKPSEQNYGEYSINLIAAWEEALWKEGGGGLYFAFQMMLMLVLGYIMALSKPISNLIDKLTIPCTNTANTALIVTLSTVLLSLFNWGLGLIFGAIFARKIGEKFSRENKKLNYPLIGAAAYSGLMVWHGGLSGSAPIKAADPGNLVSLVKDLPVNLSSIPESISMSSTVFSPMNIVVTLILLLALPISMYYLGKKTSYTEIELPQAQAEEIEKNKTSILGAEKLDNSNYFAYFIAAIILLYAVYKAINQPANSALNFITPNFINFTLLGLSILLHQNINNFTKAANSAIVSSTGILLQFPLYFGILGIMIASGLIADISGWFVSISNETTFSIYTFFSAGLVNIFVPSGGGQWAVQGPIIIAAAQELGVGYPKAIMALAYGDQLTNMLQPFWAIPLLGITGLKAKDILPYTLVLFLIGLVIFLLGLVLF